MNIQHFKIMKKTALIYTLFFLSITAIAQNLSDKKIIKLNKLNVHTENLNLQDSITQKDLNLIITLERKRKTHKTVAIVITSLAAFITVGGIALVSNKNGIVQIIGTGVLTGGLVSGGLSIPFWIASEKRKKARDKLIKNLLF